MTAFIIMWEAILCRDKINQNAPFVGKTHRPPPKSDGYPQFFCGFQMRSPSFGFKFYSTATAAFQY